MMKSFVAADMRTALRRVREELGEDAVILANRKVEGGVELLATAEMPPPPPPLPRRQPEPAPMETVASVVAPAAAVAAPAVTTAAAAVAPRTVAAPSLTGSQPSGSPSAGSPAAGFPELAGAGGAIAAGDAGWWQMQQELRSMRDLLEQQMSNFAWQQYRLEQPGQAAMWRRLQRLGLDSASVQTLFDGCQGRAIDWHDAKGSWQNMMTRLSDSIPVLGEDLIANGGVFAFVGPSGAGKTTTIGKLAARYVLEHGHEQVALVTLDSYRIGAHEQLRTLARILNVPFKIADARRDLAGVLYDLRHCKLVLIDTAGLGANAPALKEQLAAIDALGERACCVQVLAVNSQQQVLKAAHRNYRTGNLGACVFTKLDEAGSLGESIALLLGGSLPLAYVAMGQAIPGDLAVANPKQLVAKAIELAKQVECDEERLAQAFARTRPRRA